MEQTWKGWRLEDSSSNDDAEKRQARTGKGVSNPQRTRGKSAEWHKRPKGTNTRPCNASASLPQRTHMRTHASTARNHMTHVTKPHDTCAVSPVEAGSLPSYCFALSSTPNGGKRPSAIATRLLGVAAAPLLLRGQARSRRTALPAEVSTSSEQRRSERTARLREASRLGGRFYERENACSWARRAYPLLRPAGGQAEEQATQSDGASLEKERRGKRRRSPEKERYGKTSMPPQRKNDAAKRSVARWERDRSFAMGQTRWVREKKAQRPREANGRSRATSAGGVQAIKGKNGKKGMGKKKTKKKE